ncbi:MAG: insulinase family protein [Pseudomonadales bacterium]
MNSHPAFTQLHSQAIPALNLTLEQYEHKKTGAKHFHLAADKNENVFLVALRTVPHDSSGVAHILEHTALCGSKSYPVRDPFFMMTRRSLNTFMNAFTSSDWTAYPFASQNRKDFDNLLSVYLDAVFFSRLDPLDFAQEGHRVEFVEPNNPNSDLVFKGVVFNEMKGAMSSINSILWQTMSKYLFPTTTYHFNSGGEPDCIPDLSYQQLLHFYKTHYHPSNAIFMTFGDISAVEQQTKFEELALQKFDKLDEQIAVADEKRYYAPLRVTENYAIDNDETETKTHIVMGWLLGKSNDLKDALEARLLANVLLDNSSSPLLHVLETTKLGSAPSPLCGLEDSNREMSFMCGIEGSEADRVDDFEALITKTLTDLYTDGVDKSQLEAVLHQLELQQREIGGDGYPYGLQLILAALGPATHRGDPVTVLDIDPVLEYLHEKIGDPDYIKQLIKKLLLDNRHRVTLTMRPDPNLNAVREKHETQRLAVIKAAMDEQEQKRAVELASALEQRQRQQDDASVLPKVTLADVPGDTPEHPSSTATAGSVPLTFFPQGTNGLVYQQLILPLPALDDTQLELLPLYTTMLSELGVGDKDYLATQAWQAGVCGSIHAYSTVRGAINDEQKVDAFLTLSSKALTRNLAAMTELMHATFNDLRFDETDRMSELIAQISARRAQSITGNGHGLAMLAASSGMSPCAALAHRNSGLPGVKWIKNISNAAKMEDIAAQLSTLHQKVLQQSRQLLTVAEPAQQQAIEQTAQNFFQGGNQDQRIALPKIRSTSRQAWQTETQVNFCAKAFPTVCVEHADAAPLTVLGGFLRNGYLHRAIREQGGAYGGGASHDSANACFRFYSYRDPRLQETLADFDASVRWLLDSKHEPQELEESILGVVSSLDKPGSPAGEAKQQFHNGLFGRSHAQMQAFRQRVLDVSLTDLQRVGEQYLLNPDASAAVVSNEKTMQENAVWLSEQGFGLHEIS